MNKQIVAMILAGGKGTRLESLTRKIAKPAVSYGGKYRIIDFPLSNCANSGIDRVGVLTQYESVVLDSYIGNGEKWGLNGVRSLTTTLHPRQTEEGLSWYKGTADAIFRNLDFLDSLNPRYVLILSGDHIYSTTYNKMLKQHIEKGSDCTISVIEVDPKEASRFGILVTNEDGAITAFQEKPKKPISNLASMGVYIFTYRVLRALLRRDAKKQDSSHDFGKDIIPTMLKTRKKLHAYVFDGYWKDVGTISSLHEANMDLLISNYEDAKSVIKTKNTIFSEDTNSHPQYIGKKAKVKDSLINQGAVILGEIERCVVSNEVLVAEGAVVKNSVLMPGVKIRANAQVHNAIVAPEVTIAAGEEINLDNEEVLLVTQRRRKR